MSTRNQKLQSRRGQFRRQLPLHLMLIPGIIVVLIYNYLPMFGLSIAFQNFKPTKGFLGSAWVGLKNFEKFFAYPDTPRIIWNTVYIAFFKLLLGIIVPVIFALLLNEVRRPRFMKRVQTFTYLPYFLSWVVLGGIFKNILSPSNGIVNKIIEVFGGDPVYFLGSNDYFRWTMILTDVWKGFGYGSIVYLSSVMSIDEALYEAAAIDGAGRFRQTMMVTLPGISSVIFIMAVLSLGNILNAGFDQIFNMYSPQVYATGDILDTYIYRLGMVDAKYSLSTAVSLIKGGISLVLISITYYLAYRFGDYRIF